MSESGRDSDDAYEAEKADAFRAGAAAAEKTDDGDDGAAADQRHGHPVNNEHRPGRIVLQQDADQQRLLKYVDPQSDSDQHPPCQLHNAHHSNVYIMARKSNRYNAGYIIYYLFYLFIYYQWLKWGPRGARGLSPLLRFEPPAILWAPPPDGIDKVLFYAQITPN